MVSELGAVWFGDDGGECCFYFGIVGMKLWLDEGRFL